MLACVRVRITSRKFYEMDLNIVRRRRTGIDMRFTIQQKKSGYWFETWKGTHVTTLTIKSCSNMDKPISMIDLSDLKTFQ